MFVIKDIGCDEVRVEKNEEDEIEIVTTKPRRRR
jgi:hypothetical protein